MLVGCVVLDETCGGKTLIQTVIKAVIVLKLLPCGPIGPKLMVLLLPLIALHNLLLVLDVLYILLNKTRILTLNSPLLFSFSLFLYILVPLDPLTLRPCSLLLLLPSSFLFLEEQRLE